MLAGGIALLTNWAVYAEGEQVLGETSLPNFTLADFRGKDWSLTDFADKKIVVLAFVGTECPLAQKYLLRLQQLSAEYAERGVAFVGINANRQDSLAKIGA
jgi:peroxiredoxin